MKRTVRQGRVRYTALVLLAAAMSLFPTKEITLMKEVFGKELPPIDRELPARTETATFALG